MLISRRLWHRYKRMKRKWKEYQQVEVVFIFYLIPIWVNIQPVGYLNPNGVFYDKITFPIADKAL